MTDHRKEVHGVMKKHGYKKEGAYMSEDGDHHTYTRKRKEHEHTVQLQHFKHHVSLQHEYEGPGKRWNVSQDKLKAPDLDEHLKAHGDD